MENPHYVTPEEADVKSCAVDPQKRFCSGPSCMAWRWAMNFEKVDTPDGAEWSDLYSATHGYCGMVRT